MSDLKHKSPNELAADIGSTESKIVGLDSDIANGEADLALLDKRIADLKAQRDSIAINNHRRRSFRAGLKQRLMWAEHYFEEKTRG